MNNLIIIALLVNILIDAWIIANSIKGIKKDKILSAEIRKATEAQLRFNEFLRKETENLKTINTTSTVKINGEKLRKSMEGVSKYIRVGGL